MGFWGRVDGPNQAYRLRKIHFPTCFHFDFIIDFRMISLNKAILSVNIFYYIIRYINNKISYD